MVWFRVILGMRRTNINNVLHPRHTLEGDLFSSYQQDSTYARSYDTLETLLCDCGTIIFDDDKLYSCWRLGRAAQLRSVLVDVRRAPSAGDVHPAPVGAADPSACRVRFFWRHPLAADMELSESKGSEVFAGLQRLVSAPQTADQQGKLICLHAYHHREGACRPVLCVMKHIKCPIIKRVSRPVIFFVLSSAVVFTHDCLSWSQTWHGRQVC